MWRLSTSCFLTILVTMVKNAVLILGYAGVMLYLNWKLALVSFILLPLVVYLTRLFTKLYRTTHRITRTKVSALNTYLSENLSAMKLIQVFHREKEKQREFRQRSGDLFQSNFREIVVYGTFRPVIYFISILALASVLGFGGKQVMDGALSIGTLYIFTSYVKSFFEPIQSLSDQFWNASGGNGSRRKNLYADGRGAPDSPAGASQAAACGQGQN